MDKQPKLNKKIRKGDKVVAISGNFRGKTGTVLRRDDERAVVQGLNIRKKHIKRSQANPNGGILEMEKSIHLSNLKVCDATDKPLKLKVRENKKGQRELYYKTDSKEHVYRSVKKS